MVAVVLHSLVASEGVPPGSGTEIVVLLNNCSGLRMVDRLVIFAHTVGKQNRVGSQRIRREKTGCLTYPVSPVTRVVTISLAIKVIHLCCVFCGRTLQVEVGRIDLSNGGCAEGGVVGLFSQKDKVGNVDYYQTAPHENLPC